MYFEFDPEKSETNLAKHGIDFNEAKALWLDTRRRVIAARKGPGEEQRLAVIGRINDLIWTAIVTYRGEVVRIISVRRARTREETLYE